MSIFAVILAGLKLTLKLKTDIVKLIIRRSISVWNQETAGGKR